MYLSFSGSKLQAGGLAIALAIPSADRAFGASEVTSQTWGAWCYEMTGSTFGRQSQLSDGIRSDPGKDFTQRCRRWEHSTWLKMSGAPKPGTRPEELDMSNLTWRRCMKEAGLVHKAKDQKWLRLKAERDCEVKRKLLLLSIGAIPATHYDYRPGAAVDEHFASGQWRLKR